MTIYVRLLFEDNPTLNDIEGTVDLEAQLTIFWTDPRLKMDEDCRAIIGLEDSEDCEGFEDQISVSTLEGFFWNPPVQVSPS